VALFGMDSLAERCHALEDAMASTGEPPRSEELHALVAAWRQRLKSIDGFLHAGRNGVFEVKTEEHNQLLRSITERLDYAELLTMVETWTWTQGSDVLGRIRSQLEFLAKKLGKPVQVSTRDNGVRLPPGYLERFWPTLVHVTRNAVDHGIESESQRVELGKSVEANLTLTLAQTQQHLLVEISDDGPGLDREALKRRAKEQGISLAEGEPVEMLIFKDGLTTRHEATELSGRGVGLSATLEACRAAGGRVEVISAPNRGTTLRFRFPLPPAKRGVNKPESGVRATLPPAKVG
jgi:two-component system chemotaxis sensor kinase CheA